MSCSRSLTHCITTEGLYPDAAVTAGSAVNQTTYQWSFAEKGSSAHANVLRATREVDAATYHRSGVLVDMLALPSASDLVLAREVASKAYEHGVKRRRDRSEAKERLDDMAGPKKMGRDEMLEKKRVRRENDHAFQEKRGRWDDGCEADESTLLGAGDSFKPQS